MAVAVAALFIARAAAGDDVFLVVTNAEVSGGALGGGGVEGLADKREEVTVEFPAGVRDVIDGRGSRRLGDGKRFRFDFKSGDSGCVG